MKVFIAIFALLASTILIASGADYGKWSWARELPKEIATGKPVTNRTAAAVDALFARDARVSLDDVLALLGQPDGFSRQSLYSRTRGSAEPQSQGGTLRFLLSGDAELLIRTGDFHIIYEAIRYDKNGKGTLLEK